jgi:hypothetical protein
MSEQIGRIKSKLEQLKKLDTEFKLFGSHNHRYILNRILPIAVIKKFENKYEIKLPNDYVSFLTEAGNGGAGPFYGLEPFENALFVDLDYKRKDSLLNPSKQFLHTEPWNLDFTPTVTYEKNKEEYSRQTSDFENVYFDNEQMNGTIAICNYGCGVSLNLVVNGKEYGNIWSDDRGSDQGIYPSFELGNKDKIKFLDWYELWLDTSLVGVSVKTPSELLPNDKTGIKPWWKIW